MTRGTKLGASRRVASPGDLADLIKDVAEAVRHGDLHQIVPAGAPFASAEDVRNMPPGGPWPDYLELHFQDSKTGKHYKLIAETYHGRGGTWEVVP